MLLPNRALGTNFKAFRMCSQSPTQRYSRRIWYISCKKAWAQLPANALFKSRLSAFGQVRAQGNVRNKFFAGLSRRGEQAMFLQQAAELMVAKP